MDLDCAAFAATKLRNDCPGLQADLAAYMNDAWQDWARAYAPELLIEQTGAVDERYAQANDARRGLVAAE